jgi:AraC family transcriptional regulator
MEALSDTRYVERPLEFTKRAGSCSRLWSGFKVGICDASGGTGETADFPLHQVLMLVGPAIHTTCRCDGVVSSRFQRPGDFDVVPSGYSATWIHASPTIALFVNVTPALVSTAAEGMGLNPACVAIQPHLNARDPRIEHLCRALEAELLTEEPFDRVYADGLGLALATQLIRHYAPVATPRIRNGLSKGRLRKVTDYIGDNLALDLSLSELADVASVSPSHFKMLFKASVGLPVHQYVIRRRVESAIDLIVSGTLPLSDVALQVGFANQSHMARCMRRFAGVTPGALRHAE